MLNVIKEQKGDVLIVKLTGSIDETSNFEKLIGTIAAREVHVSSKEVPRINSLGVKSWIKYFSDLKTRGIQLKFIECSSAIMEQMNLISNFAAGGSVESVYVPYSCAKCKAELVGLYKTADLKKINYVIPPQKCGKCGGQADFDDEPDSYFGFLMR